MNPFSFLYTEVLFRPLLNLLVGVTNVLPTHNVGIAIIAVTFIVRLLLFPSSWHQAKIQQRNQVKNVAIQDEIKKIQRKYKDDKQKQAQETMAAYRRAGLNPAAGCLPLLIQLPILIALYRVFLIGLSPETYQHLYSFVGVPAQLATTFFSIPLGEPSLRLAILAGAGQFIQMKFFMPHPSSQPAAPGGSEETAQMMASMQRNMSYMFPVMTVFISLQLPAALALYWVTTTVFGIVQQVLLKRWLKLSSNIATV